LESVSHCRLAWSAKNKPLRNIASVVAAVSETVLVGISNQVKDTGDGVSDSLHAPLKLKAPAGSEDKELVVVGKGKMPIPGTHIEDDEDDNPETVELELVNRVTVKFELDAVPEAEIEMLEVIEPVWL
jgi:hypothetical protein